MLVSKYIVYIRRFIYETYTKKRIVSLALVGILAISSTSSVSAVYASKNLSWPWGKDYGDNVSVLGGTWNYGMTRAYEAYSEYNHSTKKHRSGVYTPESHWVFTAICGKGIKTYIARYQVGCNKGVTCSTF